MVEGGLFLLAKIIVALFLKEKEHKVEMLEYIKIKVMQSKIKNKSDLPASE